MNGFTYTLILEEPVLANSLSGDTNSAHSLPYVPGGLIRGALIQLYPGEKKANNKDFQRLFLNGSTRFLHAYPESGGKRTLPTPLAWKTYKDERIKIVENFTRTIKTDPDLKNASFDFHLLEGRVVHKVKNEWQINVHTQRDAVYGRAKGAGQGAVYRYEALPAGLHLKGVVLTENNTDAGLLKELLKGPVMLGKARTAGYGKARLVIDEAFEPNWREDHSIELPTGKVHEFVITFLSQFILRDENGQITLDPLAALRRKLIATDLDIKNRFHKAETVGGFNRQWGMPLPQNQALSAGSVFVLTSIAGVESKALHDLEVSGLGERLAEGFGRLAVSLNQTDHYDLGEDAKLTFEPAPVAIVSTDQKPVADLVLKRLLRRELDERMMSTVIDSLPAYTGGVKNSQLSRWRINLRSAISMKQDGLEKIRKFYKKEDTRNSPSWQKMTRARVKMGDTPQRLTEWMSGLLENPNEVWGMMGYKAKPIRKIGEQEFETDYDLEIEYSLRLIDAVLASLAKKNAAGGENG